MPGLELTAVTPSPQPVPTQGRPAVAPGTERAFADLLPAWLSPLAAGLDVSSIEAAEPEAEDTGDVDSDPIDSDVAAPELPATVIAVAFIPTPEIAIAIETAPTEAAESALGSLAPPSPSTVEGPAALLPLAKEASEVIPPAAVDTPPTTEAVAARPTLPPARDFVNPSRVSAELYPRANTTAGQYASTVLQASGHNGAASNMSVKAHAHTKPEILSSSGVLAWDPDELAPSGDVVQTTFQEADPVPTHNAPAGSPDSALEPRLNAKNEPAPVSKSDAYGSVPEAQAPTPASVREATTSLGVASQTEARVSPANIPHTIVRMASDPEQRTQSVKIRLDPPRLGEISVDLRMGDHGLAVRVVSQTPETRDLLQQDLPRLQELLKASGVHLQLFSATCDPNDGRKQPAEPPSLQRDAPSRATFPSESGGPTGYVRARSFDTSVRINAHA